MVFQENFVNIANMKDTHLIIALNGWATPISGKALENEYFINKQARKLAHYNSLDPQILATVCQEVYKLLTSKMYTTVMKAVRQHIMTVQL